MTGKCVLIVEDEFLIAEMLSLMLEDMGISVCGKATTADEAVRLAWLHKPLLVLMDVRLKGEKDGVDAALEIRPLMPVPVIYLTGSREPAMIERINMNHPAGVLFKPFQYKQLKEVVQRVLG
jgi:two-component system, response regulator PdtaR